MCHRKISFGYALGVGIALTHGSNYVDPDLDE